MRLPKAKRRSSGKAPGVPGTKRGLIFILAEDKLWPRRRSEENESQQEKKEQPTVFHFLILPGFVFICKLCPCML